MGCWLAIYMPSMQPARAGDYVQRMAGCNALYGSHIHFLQERGGSSLPAIKKYVAQHYPSLPGPWEKTLSYQIKKMAESGKLVKVKFHLFSDRCYMAQHLPLPWACLGALEPGGTSDWPPTRPWDSHIPLQSARAALGARIRRTSGSKAWGRARFKVALWRSSENSLAANSAAQPQRNAVERHQGSSLGQESAEMAQNSARKSL